jgi:eukaryotic-like serine/threonine-protein kinase
MQTSGTAANRMSTTQLAQLIRFSELVTEDQLQQVARACKVKYGDQWDQNPNLLAENLVGAGALTSWQAQQLLQGKKQKFLLGKYKLLQPIGRGGMGMVYLAEHTRMKRRLAIKVLPKELFSDQNRVRRMEGEARAVAMLDHPNIVRCYDFDVADQYHFIAMEFVEGMDLGRLIQRDGPMAISLAVEFVRQASMGLAHAHQKGIIHRDIKPSNLLVTRECQLKVADLGLALLRHDAEGEDGQMTRDEHVLGTVDYMAPEQAMDSHHVDPRADIYSLGCTFYQLLTGHPPFRGGSLAQRIARHQTEMPARIIEQRADCPPLVEQLCWRMIQKRPDDRIATAAEVATRCSALLRKRGSGSNPGLGTGPIVQPVGVSRPSPPPISGTGSIFDDLPPLTDGRGSTFPAMSSEQATLPSSASRPVVYASPATSAAPQWNVASPPPQTFGAAASPAKSLPAGDRSRSDRRVVIGLALAVFGLIVVGGVAAWGWIRPGETRGTPIRNTEGNKRIIILDNE